MVLGLRDILDAPAVVRQRWRLEGAYEAVERYYDRVLVYGSPDVFDVGDGVRLARGGTAEDPVLRLRLRTAPPPGSPSRCGAGTSERTGTRRLVVAMAGGGADAYRAVRALLRRCHYIQATAGAVVVLVTGPFLPAADRARLQRARRRAPGQLLPGRRLRRLPGRRRSGGGDGGLQHHRRDPHLGDARAAGAPGRPERRAADARPAVRGTRLGGLAAPPGPQRGTLGKAVAAILDGPAPTPVRLPDLGGRRAGTDRLLDSLDGRRSPRVAAVAARRAAPTLLGPVSSVRDDDYLLA